jgi:hypothetical protein
VVLARIQVFPDHLAVPVVFADQPALAAALDGPPALEHLGRKQPPARQHLHHPAARVPQLPRVHHLARHVDQPRGVAPYACDQRNPRRRVAAVPFGEAGSLNAHVAVSSPGPACALNRAWIAAFRQNVNRP